MKNEDTYMNQLLKPIRGKIKLPKLVNAHHGSEPVKSIRTAEYRGKKIEVHTSYKFFIDDKPIEIHASVMNNGKVHCHNLPQYAFSSAIRMMKSVINVMDFDMPPNELYDKTATKHKDNQHHGG